MVTAPDGTTGRSALRLAITAPATGITREVDSSFFGPAPAP
jgi:hypothetical protein